MDDLTTGELDELKVSLETLCKDLRRLLDTTRDGTRPVKLDEPIGRLTRMDAIQQQSMSSANRRSYDIRLKQVQQALAAFGQDRYGACRRCTEPIGYRRLKARPESSYCLECQDEVDRKHG